MMFSNLFSNLLDEAEIEKLKDAVVKAVREENFSKAKEIQQKIDRIVFEKNWRSEDYPYYSKLQLANKGGARKSAPSTGGVKVPHR